MYKLKLKLRIKNTLHKVVLINIKIGLFCFSGKFDFENACPLFYFCFWLQFSFLPLRCKLELALNFFNSSFLLFCSSSFWLTFWYFSFPDWSCFIMTSFVISFVFPIFGAASWETSLKVFDFDTFSFISLSTQLALEKPSLRTDWILLIFLTNSKLFFLQNFRGSYSAQNFILLPKSVFPSEPIEYALYFFSSLSLKYSMNKLSFFSMVELIECLIFKDLGWDLEEKRCLNKPLSLALSLSEYPCTSTFSRQYYFWLSISEYEFRLVETVLLFLGSKFI